MVRVAHGDNPAEERQLDHKAITVKELCNLYLADGIGRLSNFAVRALMISSWLVGSSMGMSPGRVPFKILSMK
jgi:hypothetical protein